MVLASGASGLTWEVLWQHHVGLGLGVSAFGAAVTLASMMLGLGLGGLLATHLAQGGRLGQPLRAYGLAELIVGGSALLVPAGLSGLSTLDTILFALSPTLAAAFQFLGTVILLLVPATAMGTTLPILAPYAARAGTSIAVVYAVNILGAVLGVLGMTFLALPLLGLTSTALLAAALNLSVALWALSRTTAQVGFKAEPPSAWPQLPVCWLAFTSGFVVFLLEVSWFRSLRAALQSKTESFALILAAFLIALSLGATLAPKLRARAPRAIAVLLPLAGLAVLCATPAVDSFDIWAGREVFFRWISAGNMLGVGLTRLALLLVPVLLPVTLVGMLFPWLLVEHESTTGTGRLYAVNTMGAVTGALAAGFILLPSLGATRTSWLAGGLLLLAATMWSRTPRNLGAVAAAGILGLLVTARFGTPEARLRVQGMATKSFYDVQYVAEGPDSTVWVARNPATGGLTLVIDGCPATAEGPGTGYMAWMGHLPALAVPDLRKALVICFGTGQTAHAVRQHAPEMLALVDINPAVFGAAGFFKSNHGVLDDPRVHPVVMDGRAYLRRYQEPFDMVTLEPMPPNFAGSNNLYSREFYELIRARLKPAGVVAQWLPFHLVAPRHMLAIVASFNEIFPYTRLWIDPESGTGILVGGLEPWTLHSPRIPMAPLEEIEKHFWLGWQEVAALRRDVQAITDDNQLLSYGLDRLTRARGLGPQWQLKLSELNLGIVARFRVPPQLQPSSGSH